MALGPNPVEVLDILNSLPTVKYVAGNTERYVLTGDRPYPSLTDVESDPALLPRLVEVAVTFTWTSGKITQAGWYAWLATLPSKIRTILPDGTRRHLRISDADLAVLLHQCDADVVFAGHPHDVTDRLVNGVRAVNLGSVSNRLDRTEPRPTSNSTSTEISTRSNIELWTTTTAPSFRRSITSHTQRVRT